MTALDEPLGVHDDRRLPATRRDFLFVFTAAFGAVGGATAVWPLVDQMNPHPGTSPDTTFVDLASIPPGQTVTMVWRSQPVVVRHRTPDEIHQARSIPVADLIDPLARNAVLPAHAPATDANRTRAGRPEWLVVVGVCTHMGCRLKSGAAVEHDSREGWFCPCHAARFDLSGRVQGGPALTNLPVPPYRFVAPDRIEIGRS